MSLRDLDSVILKRAIDDPNYGRFAAGTGGAIVDLGDCWALVEIGREDGSSAGLIQVLLDDLQLDERAAAA